MASTQLNIEGAHDFYRRFLLDRTRSKAELYRRYGFKVVGSVHHQDWELLAAILLNDRAKVGDVGSDLERHEVKSAKMGGAFEYQYHRNHGLEKLEEDMRVDHVFITYNPDYSSIDIRHLRGEQLEGIFESWRSELIQNYSGPNPKLRFRKNVSHGYVTQHGGLLMQIRNGELTTPPTQTHFL